MTGSPCYIVTGGAGFVGSNLVAEIMRREKSARIIVIDDLRSGSFANVVEACDRIAERPFDGDFLAADTGALDWNSLLEDLKPEAVFHLASITDTTVADERAMLDANVEGFRPVLVSCVESETPLVYSSSAATYGSPPEGRDRVAFPESSAGQPNNVYGFSKWLLENAHRSVASDCAAAGLEPPHVVGLRYFNVFGPGESRKGAMASMAYKLTNQILDGGRPRLFTGGEQARDQIFVMDAVECTLAAAEPGVTPGVFNCGSGRATSFNEIADAVRSGLGRTGDDAATDYFEMPPNVRAFYQDFTCADLSETQDALDWSPRFDPVSSIAEYAAHIAQRRSR